MYLSLGLGGALCACWSGFLSLLNDSTTFFFWSWTRISLKKTNPNYMRWENSKTGVQSAHSWYISRKAKSKLTTIHIQEPNNRFWLYFYDHWPLLHQRATHSFFLQASTWCKRVAFHLGVSSHRNSLVLGDACQTVFKGLRLFCWKVKLFLPFHIFSHKVFVIRERPSCLYVLYCLIACQNSVAATGQCE